MGTWLCNGLHGFLEQQVLTRLEALCSTAALELEGCHDVTSSRVGVIAFDLILSFGKSKDRYSNTSPS